MQLVSDLGLHLYSDKITKLGISDKVVEECLSHKEDNKVIASYRTKKNINIVVVC
ncbi:hypothetical protein [Campylobacter ureolyticus]|uniref:hypothetical protein n=1 Tax=Campylobacter ureolyticus TaxID=827 RepID=UPI0026EC59C6|nr:hypothetical protein [Campylobacter ureolyticus]